MIPAWLQRTRAGDTSRAATLRLCRKCRAPVIVGLDADRAARTAYCDPTPLTELGEAVAVMQNRRTYDLMSGPSRKELSPREADHIRKPRLYPVLAEHKCGAPLAAFAVPAPARQDIDDEPPF
ncbi:hypothetical protein [Thermomonospora cellulosilytica]|uniref:Uncharacterized protein n=1 Tax=Thermomonospora cellulosilytica TaxID=1411118 RepID=A0A7W3R8K1_9ACTN|nr:hypothetical protein [Thermomonospora cellulosilytica]MBA9003752.1 hypothetical protein [Thermomonospora cellulosilytica]